MHLVSAAKRARKREKLSIGRSGTNRSLRTVKRWLMTRRSSGGIYGGIRLSSGLIYPEGAVQFRALSTPSFDAPLCEPGGALLQSVLLDSENLKEL